MKNKDRKLFYILHAATQPILFFSGIVLVTYGVFWGVFMSSFGWVTNIAEDVVYWRSFDRTRAVCFQCDSIMVCPNCGGKKAER